MTDRKISRLDENGSGSPIKGPVKCKHILSPRIPTIELMNRIPFEPPEIHLSDGTRIRVEQPCQIATRPNSASCTIYDEDDRMRIVAYRNVTEIITTATAG
jgi:hypothetical protein